FPSNQYPGGAAPLPPERRDSGARVGPVVDALQPLAGGVRVDPGRGEGGVAEELLDGEEVGAGVQEVGGEGVAERVCGEVAVVGGLVEQLADDELDRAPGEAAAAERKEDGAAVAVGAGDDLVPADLVAAQGRDGGAAE